MENPLVGQVEWMRDFFNRSTEVLTEEDSSFKPSDEVMTTAQQIAHTAQTIDWFVDGAFKPEGFSTDWDGMMKELFAVTSVEAAKKWFNDACERAMKIAIETPAEEWNVPLPKETIMGGAPRQVIFPSMADHTAHHRGALTVYARLCGKTPLMPYGEM